MLTQERLKELLDYDPATGRFTRKVRTSNRINVGDEAGTIHDKHGYIAISVDDVIYLAHHLAWLYVHGYLPDALDHKNREPSDNRIDNLRECDQAKNMQNISLRSDNKTGFAGVDFHKNSGKFRSRIKVDGKTKCLGHFDTAEKASEAYLAAKAKLHEFSTEVTP